MSALCRSRKLCASAGAFTADPLISNQGQLHVEPTEPDRCWALALALSPTAFAETLEITGELMTSTCSVDASGGTITVPMGKVDVASVNASERAGMKNFSILLDCTGAGAAQDVGVRSAAP